MSLSNSSLYHPLLLCFVPSRHLLSSSDCRASVCEMDDNSWEQRCCDTDGASRHLGGQRGLEQARVLGCRERKVLSRVLFPPQTCTNHLWPFCKCRKTSTTAAKVLISKTLLWWNEILSSFFMWTASLFPHLNLMPQLKPKFWIGRDPPWMDASLTTAI